VFRIDTRRAGTSSHQGRVPEQRRPVGKSIRFCFATLYVSGVMYAKRAASASRVSVPSAPRAEHAISAPRYSAEPCAYRESVRPAASGWTNVSAALGYASSRFRDGEVTSVERVAEYVGSALAAIFAIERWSAKVGGRSHCDAARGWATA
jgi:hypothetical protein